MLTDKLRDGAQGRVFKVLFWIIILSFVFAGVGNYLIPRMNTSPVKVGDVEVSAEQWNAQYQNQVRAMQMRFGSRINELLENPEYVKALRMQTLERIIDNVALNSVIYNEGVRVGDEQVKEQIRTDASFQKDGKFNNELFLATVKNWGSSPDYFAEQLRTELSAQTVVGPILAVNSINYPSEVEMLSKLFAQQRVVDLYAVDAAKISNTVDVTDDEAKKFYDENNRLFMEPANVKLGYIVLSVDGLKKEVAYDDAALEDYYNMNQNDFEVPSKRSASQILIKAGTEDFDKKAEQALAELKNGKSFEEVGAAYSEDPDFSTNHGSLGELEKGSLSKELDIALFAIPSVGSVSNVVVDESGAHILKLDAVIDAYVPPFADIKDDVKDRYIDVKALELYNDRSAKLADISYEQPDSLEPAAEAVNAAVLQGEISLGDRKAVWPLNTDEVQKAAFAEDNRSSNQNSLVINIGSDACAVVNVSSYKDASLKNFDEVKDAALKFAKAKKVDDKALALLNEIAKAVADGNEAPANDAVKVSKGVTLTRAPSETISPSFALSVFAIDNTVNSYVIDRNNGVQTLAVLKEVTLDSENDLAQYEGMIRSQLVQFNQDATESMLHLGARELSDVTYNEDAINLINQQVNSQE